MNLTEKIKLRKSGLLFYGITPPKAQTEEDKIIEIASRQIERIKSLPIDGLVLYDVQDESSRTNMPRPFPFLQTLPPDVYESKYLKELEVPKIIYKSVGNHTESNFKEWLHGASLNNCFVFVGAPSKKLETSLSLPSAYSLHEKYMPHLTLGGVTIPERHASKRNEHERVMDKTVKGCSFFISQCVYNTDNAKNFISDYYYTCKKNEVELAPLIFTLTPCGSLKTLEFMNWLGIDIPIWLKNDLSNSIDILSESLKFCESIAYELFEYCSIKGIPVGFNIESVAIRKAEIEASVELLKSVKLIMNS